MFGELAEIIVKCLGGIWLVKEKVNGMPQGMKKKLMLLLYDICLRNMGGYIGVSAIISSPPCLPHGLKGVFISGGASIGENCVIFQNVTVGSNPIPTSKTCGFPAIGNNCYIGAGAAIIGHIVIGDNCRIAANCSVFFNMPPNSIAVPSTPRVIQKGEKNINKYYKWSEEGPVYYDKGSWQLEQDQEIIQLFAGKL